MNKYVLILIISFLVSCSNNEDNTQRQENIEIAQAWMDNLFIHSDLDAAKSLMHEDFTFVYMGIIEPGGVAHGKDGFIDDYLPIVGELLLRANYFGEYYAVHADWFGNDADSAMTFDMEVTYSLNDSFDISVGGQNIFDQDAERIEGSAGAVAEGVPGNVLGAIFYETSPMGIEGAYWYVKAGYNF